MNQYRYRLASDVSNCYGSIYTHSLEWALHTKAASKARLAARGPIPLGGALDRAVCNGQEGQTKGIPVGPDTSLILAEIVLSAVDQEMQRLFPKIGAYAVRATDDFEAFVTSQGHAEDVLMTWQTLLGQYELSISAPKTSISEGLAPLEPPWVTALKQFRFEAKSDPARATELYSYFSVAFELARRWAPDNVLGLALTLATPRTTGPKSLDVLQDMALTSATAEPSSLRHVALALERCVHAGHSLRGDRIEETLNEICRFHARWEHGSEVAWALWMLLRFGFAIDESAAKTVASMDDNCCLILLSDAIASGRVAGAAPDMSGPVARATATNAAATEDWLLAYESARHGWASDTAIRADAHWAELLDLGVEFYVGPPPAAPKTPSGTEPESTEPERTEFGPTDPEPEPEPEPEPGPIDPEPEPTAPQPTEFEPADAAAVAAMVVGRINDWFLRMPTVDDY